MATSTDRFFKVGETVHLRVGVSKPGTREPTDATVTLVSLHHDEQPLTVSNPAFTRAGVGDYEYVLATHSLLPGTYKVVARVSGGETKISILVDQFVLRAP